MKYIYICKKLDIIKEETSFENIYIDNVKEEVKVYNRFKKQYLKMHIFKKSEIKEKTNKEETTSHKILSCDPLSSLSEYSNGNK